MILLKRLYLFLLFVCIFVGTTPHDTSAFTCPFAWFFSAAGRAERNAEKEKHKRDEIQNSIAKLKIGGNWAAFGAYLELPDLIPSTTLQEIIDIANAICDQSEGQQGSRYPGSFGGIAGSMHRNRLRSEVLKLTFERLGFYGTSEFNRSSVAQAQNRLRPLLEAIGYFQK